MQKASESQVGRRRLGGRSLRGLFGGRSSASGARDRLTRRSMLGRCLGSRKERIVGNGTAWRLRFGLVREGEVVALLLVGGLRVSGRYETTVGTQKEHKIESERKNQQPPLVAACCRLSVARQCGAGRYGAKSW